MDNRWRQIEELYHAAREQPPEQRADFLHLECGPDHALRSEVESLLIRDSQTGGALDHAAWEGMESLLDAPTPADQTQDESIAAGTLIGPYRIAEVLGSGGMGCVYRADDTRLGRVVAVKVSKMRFSERFEREARAIAALNHPNICQLYDVGPNFLVMEFVDGAPVTVGYGIRRTISIAVQIAEGLASAHAGGVTHRDLKPDNILLTRADQVKIVDFGLAKVTDPRGAVASVQPGALRTEPGMIMGTVDYMSPEQVRGQEADHRSDIFSLGQIVYEMLTGRRAFTGETLPDVMSAILRHEAPALPESVPALLRQIVSRCLEKDPANRFQSAKDLAFALANFNYEAAPAAAAEEAEPLHTAPIEAVRRFRAPAAVALAIAVTAAVAALAIASQPGPLDTAGFRFTPVAVDARDAHHPAWSPDGRSLAYFERAGTTRRIVIRDLYRGTPPLPLIQVRDDRSLLSWSPDGERIYYLEPGEGVFSISRAGGQPKIVLASPRESRSTYDLPVLSPDGKTLALLVTNRSQSEPVTRVAFSSPPGAEPKPVGDALPCCGSSIAWTADSKQILVSNHNPVGDSIFSLTVDGRRRLLQQIPGAGPFGVELSAIANGRHIVASRITGDDAFGLALIDGEDGDLQRLLPSHTPITSPSVSRDGSRLAYTSRNVYAQAYEIPLTGGAPLPLAPSSLSQFGVAFSPRGAEFSYTRFGQLILHSRNTLEERVLVSSEDFPSSLYKPDLLWPTFSRAGDRIMFTCVGCEKDLSLWVVPVSGGSPARVAGDGNGGISVSWSPDGAQIVYVRQSLSGLSETAKLRLGSGDKPERIAEDPCMPSWSPAGDWILCSGRTNKLISPDGSQVRELGETSGGAAWSNDGKSIYNVRRAADRMIIEQLDPATGKRETLTQCPIDGPCPGGQMSVSADGKSIAFTALAGDGDIWILDGFQPPRTLWERLWP